MITTERGNIVEVNGGTKKQREFTAKIAHWCIKQLMPRMRTLDIYIDLKKELDGKRDRHGLSNFATRGVFDEDGAAARVMGLNNRAVRFRKTGSKASAISSATFKPFFLASSASDGSCSFSASPKL